MTIREKIERRDNIIKDFKDLKNRFDVCGIKAARMLSSKYGLKPSTLIQLNYEKI